MLMSIKLKFLGLLSLLLLGGCIVSPAPENANNNNTQTTETQESEDINTVSEPPVSTTPEPPITPPDNVEPSEPPPPPDVSDYTAQGKVTWYAIAEHGKGTADGETYDYYGKTAAHPDLPLGAKVKVKNKRTGQQAVVQITDRFNEADYVIKLSRSVAEELGLIQKDSTVIVQGFSSQGESTLMQATHLSTSPQHTATQYYLQIGAFRDQNRAKTLQQNLQPHISSPIIIVPGKFYKVRIGPLDNLLKVENMKAQLRTRGFHDFLTISSSSSNY